MARRATTAAAAGALGVGLVLGLTGCSMHDSGPVVTRDVAIEDVTAVDLATSGDLVVRRGDTPSLTVTAPEGTQDRLTTRVRDGVLELDSRSTFGFSRMGDVRYELVVSELTRVVVSGSGDVEGADVTGSTLTVLLEGSGDIDFDGVDADEVDAVIEGSGGITLSGRSGTARLSIEGSGDIDADRLRVEDAEVSIEGSGDIGVDATRRLDARIGGSGSVTYPGEPEVTSDVDGSGSVTRDRD